MKISCTLHRLSMLKISHFSEYVCHRILTSTTSHPVTKNPRSYFELDLVARVLWDYVVVNSLLMLGACARVTVIILCVCVC